jgi:hypothetical protein
VTLREVVWVSHPYGQDPANLARAKRWVAYLERKHPEWIIRAPWIGWAEIGRFANDEPAAIEACECEIANCGRLISVGTREPSPGMRSEWMHALRIGLGVLVYSTEAEPPANQVGTTVGRAQSFLARVSELLAEKNRAYGDSVANPVRIFSASAADEGVRVRIDDKLSRIVRGNAAGEDVLADLCGYVALLAAMEEEKRGKA